MSDKIPPIEEPGSHRKPCLKCRKYKWNDDPHDTRCFRCCGCSPDLPCDSAQRWDFKAFYLWKANAFKTGVAKQKRTNGKSSSTSSTLSATNVSTGGGGGGKFK
jgi:hypothetical protein